MKTLQEELKAYVEKLVDQEEVSIVNLKNGALIETFDNALRDVIRNCADINTTLEKREVTMKMIIKPKKDRDMIEFKVSINCKLAGMEPIEGMANVEIDAKGAGFVATRRPEAQQQPIFTNVTAIK